MNVYDFDGTIFKSNCTVSFALWCMMRHPKLWFTYCPGILMAYQSRTNPLKIRYLSVF